MKQSGNNPKVMVLFGVLVLAAIYLLLLKPKGAELSALRDDAISAQQGVDDALVVLAQMRPESGDESDAAVEELALGQAVPPSPQLSQLLRDLQTIATDTGVVYASVAPTLPGPNPAGPGGSVPLTINASGPPEAIDVYLGRIRDLARMLVIEQVSTLTSSGEVVETQVQLTVRAFTTATPPTVPAA